MIYELRTYSFFPGKMPAYLKLAEEVGTPIRGDNYGKREGSFIAEIGTLNQVWHIWSYKDLNDRQDCRKRLSENKDWTGEFIAQVKPLLKAQHIRFMNNVSPMKPPEFEKNIYEFRVYQTSVGDAAGWAKDFVEALPARERYSRNLGLWIPESDNPNEVVHLWGYKDLIQRAEARAAAQQDPDWRAFLAKAGGRLLNMNSTIVLPAKFSPMQ